MEVRSARVSPKCARISFAHKKPTSLKAPSSQRRMAIILVHGSERPERCGVRGRDERLSPALELSEPWTLLIAFVARTTAPPLRRFPRHHGNASTLRRVPT